MDGVFFWTKRLDLCAGTFFPSPREKSEGYEPMNRTCLAVFPANASVRFPWAQAGVTCVMADYPEGKQRSAAGTVLS